MNAIRYKLRVAAIGVFILAFLVLVACGPQVENTTSPNLTVPLGTPEGTEANLAPVQNNANNPAAATAEIERVNAQATLNSANATLSAAQIQQQNSSDVVAAQVAAAAQIVQANAQATLVAANSTQSAAQTQDAFQQTQVQEQQNRNMIAASTQTAVANLIATQTQSAVATTQWYADQSRQQAAERQAPITFLITWCLPAFIVLFAALGLWGFWRWLKIKQANQRSSGEPIGKGQALAKTGKLPDRFQPSANDPANGSYPSSKSEDQMRGWLDEIKHKLIDRKKGK